MTTPAPATPAFMAHLHSLPKLGNCPLVPRFDMCSMVWNVVQIAWVGLCPCVFVVNEGILLKDIPAPWVQSKLRCGLLMHKGDLEAAVENCYLLTATLMTFLHVRVRLPELGMLTDTLC